MSSASRGEVSGVGVVRGLNAASSATDAEQYQQDFFTGISFARGVQMDQKYVKAAYAVGIVYRQKHENAHDPTLANNGTAQGTMRAERQDAVTPSIPRRLSHRRPNDSRPRGSS